MKKTEVMKKILSILLCLCMLVQNAPLGQAYLLPYWNGRNNCYECQFQ